MSKEVHNRKGEKERKIRNTKRSSKQPNLRQEQNCTAKKSNKIGMPL